MKTGLAVLLINSPGSAGAEKAVAGAVAGLASQGIHVRLLCLERPSHDARGPITLPVQFLSGLPASAHPAVKLLWLVPLAFRLSRYVSRHRTPVVMSHLFRANFVNVLARLLAGSSHRAILVNHTRVARLFAEGLQGRINWILTRLLFPKADLVASASTGAALECGRLLGLPTGRIVTLYDPVDTSCPTRAAEVRLEAVAGVGRLIPLKRFGDLIYVFGRIAEAFPLLELRLIGDGPERQRLEDAAAASGFPHRIRFLGHREAPMDSVAGCRAFVSTSETEGFGMAIVEALSAGVPVVAADCAYGPREILAPSTDPTRLLQKDAGFEIAEFGILVPVGSLDALEHALRRLLGDSLLQAELSRRGPLRASDFSVDKSTAMYKSLLFSA